MFIENTHLTFEKFCKHPLVWIMVKIPVLENSEFPCFTLHETMGSCLSGGQHQHVPSRRNFIPSRCFKLHDGLGNDGGIRRRQVTNYVAVVDCSLARAG